MADLLCGGVGRRLTLLERRAQALRALCSTHEKKLYFAGAGRVRVIVRAAGAPTQATFRCRRARTQFWNTFILGERIWPIPEAQALETRAAGASAGIFAGSRGAVVADLVPFRRTTNTG